MITLTRRDCRPVSLRHASTLLQAMGHPVRLQILEALRHHPDTVGEIVSRLGLSQPVVSRHLAILRRASLVTVRTEGRERIYRIGNDQAEAILSLLFSSTPESNAA